MKTNNDVKMFIRIKGLSMVQISKHLKINVRTLYRWIDKNDSYHRDLILKAVEEIERETEE